MGVALFVSALLAFRAVAGTGAEHDAEAHKLRTRAAAAVDLAAPTAEIARVRAEKQARALCERRFKSALVHLGSSEAAAEGLAAKYTVKKVDYMTDGAVVIEAELDVKQGSK